MIFSIDMEEYQLQNFPPHGCYIHSSNQRNDVFSINSIGFRRRSNTSTGIVSYCDEEKSVSNSRDLSLPFSSYNADNSLETSWQDLAATPDSNFYFKNSRKTEISQPISSHYLFSQNEAQHSIEKKINDESLMTENLTVLETNPKFTLVCEENFGNDITHFTTFSDFMDDSSEFSRYDIDAALLQSLNKYEQGCKDVNYFCTNERNTEIDSTVRKQNIQHFMEAAPTVLDVSEYNMQRANFHPRLASSKNVQQNVSSPDAQQETLVSSCSSSCRGSEILNTQEVILTSSQASSDVPRSTLAEKLSNSFFLPPSSPEKSLNPFVFPFEKQSLVESEVPMSLQKDALNVLHCSQNSFKNEKVSASLDVKNNSPFFNVVAGMNSVPSSSNGENPAIASYASDDCGSFYATPQLSFSLNEVGSNYPCNHSISGNLHNQYCSTREEKFCALSPLNLSARVESADYSPLWSVASDVQLPEAFLDLADACTQHSMCSAPPIQPQDGTNYQEEEFAALLATQTDSHLRSLGKDGQVTDGNVLEDFCFENKSLYDEEHSRCYEVLSVVGRGAFGQVLKCIERDLETFCFLDFVAVKVIKDVASFYAQALSETRILSHIRDVLDPHDQHGIIRLRHCFYFRRNFCMVMELLNQNVYQALKLTNFGGFPLEIVQQITAQLIDAIFLLEKGGIAHCDIKPENILIDSVKTISSEVTSFSSAQNVSSSNTVNPRTQFVSDTVIFHPSASVCSSSFNSSEEDVSLERGISKIRHFERISARCHSVATVDSYEKVNLGNTDTSNTGHFYALKTQNHLLKPTSSRKVSATSETCMSTLPESIFNGRHTNNAHTVNEFVAAQNSLAYHANICPDTFLQNCNITHVASSPCLQAFPNFLMPSHSSQKEAGKDFKFSDYINTLFMKIKLIDFGSSHTLKNPVFSYIQSRFYRAPEILLGLPSNGRVDLWSVGCVMFELFTGLPLFPGSSEYDQMYRICDLLGFPPPWMLEEGSYVNKFFRKHTSSSSTKRSSILTPAHAENQPFDSNFVITVTEPLDSQNGDAYKNETKIAHCDKLISIRDMNSFESTIHSSGGDAKKETSVLKDGGEYKGWDVAKRRHKIGLLVLKEAINVANQQGSSSSQSLDQLLQAWQQVTHSTARTATKQIQNITLLKQFVDLLAALLKIDPYKRISCEQCWNHPFIKNVNLWYCHKNAGTIVYPPEGNLFFNLQSRKENVFNPKDASFLSPKHTLKSFLEPTCLSSPLHNFVSSETEMNARMRTYALRVSASAKTVSSKISRDSFENTTMIGKLNRLKLSSSVNNYLENVNPRVDNGTGVEINKDCKSIGLGNARASLLRKSNLAVSASLCHDQAHFQSSNDRTRKEMRISERVHFSNRDSIEYKASNLGNKTNFKTKAHGHTESKLGDNTTSCMTTNQKAKHGFPLNTRRFRRRRMAASIDHKNYGAPTSLFCENMQPYSKNNTLLSTNTESILYAPSSSVIRNKLCDGSRIIKKNYENHLENDRKSSDVLSCASKDAGVQLLSILFPHGNIPNLTPCSPFMRPSTPDPVVRHLNIN